MLKIRRILRDYQEAGSLNSLVALWAFVDDETFITKAGHVGVVYRLAGVDYECLDHPQRREIVHRYEAALRSLDESCRVYQYLIKRTVPTIDPAPCSQRLAHEAVQRRAAYLNSRRDELYELDLHLVLVYEGLRPRGSFSRRARAVWSEPGATIRTWLSPSANLALVETDLDRAVAQLHHKAAAFEVQLADSVRPTRLSKGDAFRIFRRLLNYAPHVAAGASLQYDTHLDYFVADSSVDCHRGHLQVENVRVKVLSLKEPPSATFPQVLEELYMLPGEFIACLEWCRIPNDWMRRDLRVRRRHFFNKRVSIVNYVSPETRPEEMLVDESASTTVRQLGDAMTEMEVNGRFFGECSLTLVLYDRESRALERSAAEAVKAMAAHDGTFIEETYNLLNAWLSIVPGNSAHNLRRLALLETNYADLGFLFTLDAGQLRSSHLNAEALAIFETRHQTPYHFNVHVQDVGHTLVLGATGSGKSFLLNFLVMHAQKYEPLTVIFDLGHSYRKLAALLEGSYLELGLRQSGVRINPFALEPTRENLHFLHAFLFDDVEDTFEVQQFQVFDFEAMRAYPALLEPLLFYVLHRVASRINDPAAAAGLKLCVMDEAWRFIQHETW